MKIPNSNDIHDAAENLNEYMLKAANEMNVDEIVERYNSEQARRVAELEEEIYRLRYEIALREAAIKLLDPEYRPPVPIGNIGTPYYPGYCDGCPYENDSQIIQPL